METHHFIHVHSCEEYNNIKLVYILCSFIVCNGIIIMRTLYMQLNIIHVCIITGCIDFPCPPCLLTSKAQSQITLLARPTASTSVAHQQATDCSLRRLYYASWPTKA